MMLVKGEHPRAMESFEHANTGLYLTHWNLENFEILKENDTSHINNG